VGGVKPHRGRSSATAYARMGFCGTLEPPNGGGTPTDLLCAVAHIYYNL